METIRKYGTAPYKIGLVHGGPGAAGSLKNLAEKLSADYGVLEFLQSAKSVNGQIEELKEQVICSCQHPVILIGHSWGA